MTSIIIPVYNNFVYTQLAIESIKNYTKDYELILVDNGSKDETEILRKDRNVTYVRNESNLGFPKACNIGASKASGEFLIFLNNDVLVTPNWAELLLRHYRKIPNLGIVGCMTNKISGVQKESNLDLDKDFPCLNDIIISQAETIFKKNFNDIKIFPRITGFCMGIKRELFNEIGFDERYGMGNFEDDDLCVSVLNKGYFNAVVKDSWIYHFGSKTFDLIETQFDRTFGKGETSLRDTLCIENEKKFKEKWGFEKSEWWEEYL